MGSITNRDKVIASLESGRHDKKPRKTKNPYEKLRAKFKRLSDDYSKYKATIKDAIGDDEYQKIVERLRDGK